MVCFVLQVRPKKPAQCFVLEVSIKKPTDGQLLTSFRRSNRMFVDDFLLNMLLHLTNELDVFC